MTPLFRFLSINLGGGFAIGLIVGLGYMQSGGGELFSGQPLAIAMLLWSFAASIAMGTLGTALTFFVTED